MVFVFETNKKQIEHKYEKTSVLDYVTGLL